MNETTTTTMSDWSKDKQEFADVIIDIIKAKHKEGLQLAHIPFGIADLKHTFIGEMHGIAPSQEHQVTAKRMLDLFCSIGEVQRHSEGVYRLSKQGRLYRCINEKIARTP